MIDILCTGGALYAVRMTYDVLVEVMKDEFIKENDFIPIVFEDGSRGAVRKRDINVFYEHTEMDE